MALWFWFVVLLLEESGLALPSGNEGSPPLATASSHFLRFAYMAVSEHNHKLPQFIVVGYVNDQLIGQYDSNKRKMKLQVPWIEKVKEDDPPYWVRKNGIARNAELRFRGYLETLITRYNQSGGFHSLQQMYVCELRPDGSKGGYSQYAYDGKDYINLDLKTLTWTAASPTAQILVREWEKIKRAEREEFYLEGECIDELRRFLEYGKESLLRTEPPVGKVTRKEGYDGMETLACQAHGFYPKEIETTWRKDGEVLEHLTFRRNVAPYPDGTYHAWLSIEIDPKDRDQYQCHVEHDGLEEPLVLVWEEPASNLGLIIGCVVIVLVLFNVAAMTGFWIHKWNKKLQDGYKSPMKNNLTI